ncbi:serine kinase [Novosphingobium sp. PC22D]|uniref:HPr kinase/phosphorylase n=1 Tax=Novosphingobium sp. PC22D TaxID=1962403 RepID=UPI000BF05AA1|nr:HPr kinase/phosphatase C-terminal domain-containing protein [Novosphingobium sp. PC22D]PEQ13290.1 serine kinase [Novosphingobium sp. PC22D]
MSPRQSTCVAIGARAVLLEGAPGSGKSSLALALIDRGATLVGDDGVGLEVADGLLLASPHPATEGLIEVRNLGLLRMPAARSVPVCLVCTLEANAPRFVEHAGDVAIGGLRIPHLTLSPDSPVSAIKVELALERYGLGV